MEYIIVGILFLLVIILGIIIKGQSDKINQLNTTNLEQIKQHYANEYKAAERGFEKDYQALSKSYIQKSDYINNQLDNLTKLLKVKEEHYNEVNQDLDLYKQGKIKEIDSAAAEYEQRKHILISQSVDKYRDILIEQANNMMGTLTTEIDFTNKELETIKSELEVERRKRAAINEEIRREQLTQKEKDAHRIILSETDKEDIAFLTTIIPKLNHKEILYKLIWSEYLIKPYQNMIKQLFGGRIPKNVIYCIEYINWKSKLYM